jgi:hypothetical protein
MLLLILKVMKKERRYSIREHLQLWGLYPIEALKYEDKVINEIVYTKAIFEIASPDLRKPGHTTQ